MKIFSFIFTFLQQYKINYFVWVKVEERGSISLDRGANGIRESKPMGAVKQKKTPIRLMASYNDLFMICLKDNETNCSNKEQCMILG